MEAKNETITTFFRKKKLPAFFLKSRKGHLVYKSLQSRRGIFKGTQLSFVKNFYLLKVQKKCLKKKMHLLMKLLEIPKHFKGGHKSFIQLRKSG